MGEQVLIRIEDIHKSFGSKKVLQGVDLEILRGETMVVIGGSGTGKSVLLKHIIGLLHPDAGRVLVDGQAVGDLDEAGLSSMRRRFGMLFQGAALFDSMNVEDNVAFALKRHSGLPPAQIKERVADCLEAVGMPGIEKLKPSELSGGMKKRVGLARAIALQPEIILYDEPTTGLDPIMSDVINNLIIEMKKRLKATSIAITHDMVSAYKISDRIAMLYKGRIVEVGTPDQIRGSSNPVVQQFITGDSAGAQWRSAVSFSRGGGS